MAERDVTELTVQECRELFERVCQESLGVTTQEFLDRYPDELPLHWGHDTIVRLEVLMPFCLGVNDG